MLGKVVFCWMTVCPEKNIYTIMEKGENITGEELAVLTQFRKKFQNKDPYFKITIFAHFERFCFPQV